MYRLPISLCICAVILTNAAPARAFGWRDGVDPLAAAAADLDLSEAQQTKLKALQDEEKPRLEKLRDAAHDARKRFGEAMRNEAATDAELTAANEAMLKAKGDLMRARFERMLAVRSLLTKDQLKKFLTKLEEHHRNGARRWRGK